MPARGRVPDSKYALSVLSVVVLSNFFTAYERIQNLFLTPWMEEFGQTQTRIVIVPAVLCLSLSLGVILWPTVVAPIFGEARGLQLALVLFSGTLYGSSYLTSFGPFLVVTAVTGVSMSWLMPASGVALNRWFVKFRMITNQTMEMGRAVYVCIMPFVIQMIIDKYHWRWGLRLLAVMPLVMVPFMFFFQVTPDPPSKDGEMEAQDFKADAKRVEALETKELPASENGNANDSDAAPEKCCFCLPKPPPRPETQPLDDGQKKLMRIVSLGVLCSFLAFASGRTLFVTYGDSKFGKQTYHNTTTNETTVVREAIMLPSQRAALVSAFNFSSVGVRIIIILMKDFIIAHKIRAADMWFIGAVGCMISFGTTPVLANTFGPVGLIAAAVFQGITLGIYQGQPITVMANIVGVERLQKWMVVYTLLCGLGNFFGPITMSKISSAIGTNDAIYYGTIPLYVVVVICASALIRNKL